MIGRYKFNSKKYGRTFHLVVDFDGTTPSSQGSYPRGTCVESDGEYIVGRCQNWNPDPDAWIPIVADYSPDQSGDTEEDI